MEEYRVMWKELGLDLDAHDGLLEVLPPLFVDVIVNQPERPARMAYFDSFFAEVHGRRIAELVREKKRGRKVVGAFCAYVPEELLLALGASCVGLCGGAEVGFDAAERYLPQNTCSLIKSSLGFTLARVCPYIEASDLIVGETTCDGKKKYYEILGELKDVHVMELPQMKLPADRALWRGEVRRLVSRLEELTGEELSVDGLAEAVRVVNDKRSALLRLAGLRKASPPVISGKDALLVNQVAFLDEPRRFANKVNELCDDLERRAASGKGVAGPGAPRVLVSGCPMAVPNWKLPHVIESAGATVVMEELCTGTRYYENLVDGEQVDLGRLIDSVADRYLEIDCAVFTPNDRRIENIARMAEEYRADGVVYYSIKFCGPYSVESYRVKKSLESRGVPFLYFETDYSPGDNGQLRTRAEAFVEMLRAG